MKCIFIFFSLAMIVTRFPFGGGALHLLDVSWALFFVLGRLHFDVRTKLIGFTWFVFLGWVIDIMATEGAVVSAYCMTPAYLGMPLAYGALTFIGAMSSLLHDQQQDKNGSVAALGVVVCVVFGTFAAFVISNAFFFQFSGYFEHMSLASYSASVIQYYIPFLMSAQFYVLGWFCLNRFFSLDDKVVRSLNGASYE